VKKLMSCVVLLLPFTGIAYVLASTLFEPILDTPFKKAPRPIIGAPREPLENLPQIENFEVVGYNPLPNPGDNIALGRNGPIAIGYPVLAKPGDKTSLQGSARTRNRFSPSSCEGKFWIQPEKYGPL